MFCDEVEGGVFELQKPCLCRSRNPAQNLRTPEARVALRIAATLRGDLGSLEMSVVATPNIESRGGN